MYRYGHRIDRRGTGMDPGPFVGPQVRTIDKGSGLVVSSSMWVVDSLSDHHGWDHPVRGNSHRGRFVDVGTGVGLIVETGIWIVRSRVYLVVLNTYVHTSWTLCRVLQV